MSHPVRLAGFGLGLLLALGACDKMKAPAAPEASANAAPPAAGAGKDTCGAASHQALVGTGAGSLDSTALPKGTRVLFPGMPMTMDYRGERLNVSVGKDDKVDKVFCG